MSVSIQTTMKEDVAVLRLSGNMLGGPEIGEKFQDEIKKVVQDDIQKVIVDLDEVKRMNSTGLGILMRGYMTVKNSGGDMKLVSLNESLKGILVITQVNRIFETYSTLEEAVGSF